MSEEEWRGLIVAGGIVALIFVLTLFVSDVCAEHVRPGQMRSLDRAMKLPSGEKRPIRGRVPPRRWTCARWYTVNPDPLGVHLPVDGYGGEGEIRICYKIYDWVKMEYRRVEGFVL